ncbi:MAG: hypothetical protein ACR2KD_07545 [Thermoleophilaceae bacterium]
MTSTTVITQITTALEAAGVDPRDGFDEETLTLWLRDDVAVLTEDGGSDSEPVAEAIRAELPEGITLALVDAETGGEFRIVDTEDGLDYGDLARPMTTSETETVQEGYIAWRFLPPAREGER